MLGVEMEGRGEERIAGEDLVVLLEQVLLVWVHQLYNTSTTACNTHENQI